MERTIPYYTDKIVPDSIAQGKNVLIASSENAIRGLLMYLCEVSQTPSRRPYSTCPFLSLIFTNCYFLFSTSFPFSSLHFYLSISSLMSTSTFSPNVPSILRSLHLHSVLFVSTFASFLPTFRSYFSFLSSLFSFPLSSLIIYLLTCLLNYLLFYLLYYFSIFVSFLSLLPFPLSLFPSSTPSFSAFFF